MGLETMTTFTSEDREWAYWDNYVCPKYSQQTEIKFFWPLTEQLELNLDYGPTHLHFRAKGIAGVHSLPIRGSIHEFKPTTWGLNPIKKSILFQKHHLFGFYE